MSRPEYLSSINESLHNKPFLNKNLFFNIENKENQLSEYYLHTFTKNLNIQNYDSIRSIISNFSTQRSKNSSTDDFVYLNKHTLPNYSLEFEDKDFYVETLGCVICKQTMNNYAALFLHYKINHSNYTFFNIKHHNNHTNLKEAHIVAFADPNPNKGAHLITNLGSKERINKEISEKTIEFYYSNEEKEVLVLKALDDKDELNSIVSGEQSGNGGNIKQKTLTNSNKQVFKQYVPNPSSFVDGDLVLFDCVTGELLDCDYETRGYDMGNENYKMKLQDKWLDEICDDVAPEDKKFMKLWNRISEKYQDIQRTGVFNLCKRFIDENESRLEPIQRSFLMHLICLNEYEFISNMQVCELMYYMNEAISQKREKEEKPISSPKNENKEIIGKMKKESVTKIEDPFGIETTNANTETEKEMNSKKRDITFIPNNINLKN